MIITASLAAVSLVVGAIGSYYFFGGKPKSSYNTPTDHSVINNTGSVNNVLINNDTITVEYYELIVAIYIICALKIFEFIYFAYVVLMKKLEKKFKTKHINNNSNNINL